MAENKTSPTGSVRSLTIPQVNENPQPPNASDNITSNTNSQTSTPSGRDNRSITTQTSGPRPFSSYVPQPGKPDPRDTQYWRDVIRLNFDKENQLEDNRLQSVYAQTNFEQAGSDLNRQQVRDRLASKISASRSGNLFSSVYQEGAGQLEQDYFRQRADMETNYQREQFARERIRKALIDGYTIDEAARLAEAIDRASQNELNRPSPYQPAPTTPDTTDTMPDYDKLVEKLAKTLFTKPKPDTQGVKPPRSGGKRGRGKKGKKGKKR